MCACARPLLTASTASALWITLSAGSEVATHFTPCSIPNGCVGEAWHAFNPEEGRKLLAEVGFPDGFKTKIYYRDVVRGYLPQPGLSRRIFRRN